MEGATNHTRSRKDGGDALDDSKPVQVLAVIASARKIAKREKEYRTVHIHIDQGGRITSAGIADGISDRGGPAACEKCQD